MASPFLMIVADLDICRPLVRPHEAEPIVVVDADRMLSRSIAFHLFKPVSGRYPEIIKLIGDIKLRKLAQSNPFDLNKFCNAFHPVFMR
jgi:hypothetical protein